MLYFLAFLLLELATGSVLVAIIASDLRLDEALAGAAAACLVPFVLGTTAGTVADFEFLDLSLPDALRSQLPKADLLRLFALDAD